MAQGKNEPSVVVTEPNDDEAREQQEKLDRFWQVVERIGARNADKVPDEVLRCGDC